MPASPRTANAALLRWLSDHTPKSADYLEAVRLLDAAYIEAEAAQQAAPLDEPTLGEAFERTREHIEWPKRWTTDDFRWISRQVAAEYARLAPAQARPADAALREALTACEWGQIMYDDSEAGGNESGHYCPICAAEKPGPHSPDCIVAAALAQQPTAAEDA